MLADDHDAKLYGGQPSRGPLISVVSGTSPPIVLVSWLRGIRAVDHGKIKRAQRMEFRSSEGAIVASVS